MVTTTTTPRRVDLKTFQDELRAQKVPSEHMAVRCPICGTVQSAATLVGAGAGPDPAAVERFLGFSCVGRFTEAGPHRKGQPPGRGCNWTLGGLFSLHTMEVLTTDGAVHPTFEPATAEEAQALMSVTMTGGTAA